MAARSDNDVVLSLCMIVRDNAATLRPCLESIRPWVDEMVIVDTGSKDETPQIVEESGGRLFHFPWIDDFSAARNESLKHARGRWLFWMDSDDTIVEESGRKLREIAYGQHVPNVLGYVMQVHCPAHDAEFPEEATVVDHVKLFRNDPQIRFEGRIHEQVLMPIRRLGGEVQWTDVFVVHSGADVSPAGRRGKCERDLRILELDLAERPDHPFVLFNFGMTYNDMGRHEEAVQWLTRCLTASDPGESHVRKAHALLASSYMSLERPKEGLETCEAGLLCYPDDPELLFRSGTLLSELRQYERAVRYYRQLLEINGQRYFASIDRGITGYKARHNLAVTYQDMGRFDLAEIEWRAVIEQVPMHRPAWRALGESLLRQQKLAVAEVTAELLLAQDRLRVEGMLLKSRIEECKGQFASARDWLENAIREFPDEEEPLQVLCRFLFEHGEPTETCDAFTALVERNPEDAAAHHNLGHVCLRIDDYSDAEKAFRASLRLRPKSAGTLMGLGQALSALGKDDAALDAWREASRLSPDDNTIKELIGKHANSTLL